MNTTEKIKNQSSRFWQRNQLAFKAITIFFLVMLLLIPKDMIENLILERNDRKDAAIREVSLLWGDKQTITGPILVVPYFTTEKETVIKDDKEIINTRCIYHQAYFLPDELKIDGAVNPQVRKRGIYEVVLYDSQLHLSGEFSFPDLAKFGIDDYQVYWDQIKLVVNVSDNRGIKNNLTVQWGDSTKAFRPGFSGIDRIEHGLFATVDLKKVRPGRYGKTYEKLFETRSFAIDLNLNGSRNIRFDPLGKHTQISLSSSWPDPRFNGDFLPDNHQITPEGFTAEWNVSYLNRAYPQQWIDHRSSLTDASFGVDLILPVNPHLKVYRSAKYALLVIVLTFVIFYLIEWYTRQRFHPLQYVLVGLGLVLYYSLMLSFSEHWGFEWAYLAASLLIIGLITFYAWLTFNKKIFVLVFNAGMTTIYVFLFFTLESQDYALLIGSLGLFVILGLLMYLTRGLVKKKASVVENEKIETV